MIQMKAGVYGLPVKQPNGNIRVVRMGPNDGPFSIDPERETLLVKKGHARYVEQIQDEGEQPETDHEQIQDENDGAPIGFDEMPPEDFDEDDLPDGVIGIPEYSVDMKASELREIGKLCGLNFKVGMSKQEMVDALDAHIEANMVDDDEFIDADPDDAPTFDASEAVE